MATRKNRNTRRNRRNARSRRMGVFSKLYSPISAVIGATGNLTSGVTNTTRNVVRRGLGGVNTLGKRVTGRANTAVRNLVSRRNRRSRRGRRSHRGGRRGDAGSGGQEVGLMPEMK